MAKSVGEFVADRLVSWGVRRVFAYPGDGINGVILGVAKRSDDIEFVQVRHEEMAAFMACGHAKFTGEAGVCIATSGPGAVHLLNGLYDAKLDHQPVVAIVGQQARSALGGDYHQEIDLISLFKDVAHDYVHMASDPAQVRHLIDRAFRIALSRRAVTCVILPNDVQDMDAVEDPEHKHGTLHSSVGRPDPVVVPNDDELQRAADVLNAGERVALLVGAGALRASTEALEVADKLGAGIAKALLGKTVVDDALPYVTGAIGLLGTKPSWDMMTSCDTLLMVGTSFPYSEFLPKPGQARAVQIDIDPRAVGIRYPTEVDLVGDAAPTLTRLLPLLERKAERAWRAQIEDDVAEWWRVVEARARADADPVNPQRVLWELSSILPDDVIVTVDSGTSTDWFARDLKMKPGMLASVSGQLASMGCAIPYAIAAKAAHPERPVIALVGDGAMQMNGLNELLTVKKYWQRWSDPRFVVLVLNNGDLNHVTWEQRAMEGDAKFEAAQDLPEFPYHRYAELLGFHGIKVDSAEAIAPAWERALSADRPVVLEAVVDPNVPPIPPHVSLDQLKAFMLSLGKGDPETFGVIRQGIKQKMAEFFK